MTGEGAVSLLEFWRKYYVRSAIENVHRAWQEVPGNRLRSAWSSILRRRMGEQPGSFAFFSVAVKEMAELGTEKLGFSDLDAANIEEMLTSSGDGDLLNLVQENASEEKDDGDNDDESALDCEETDELLLRGFKKCFPLWRP
ncbi:hypothetical protein TTRE_0000900701 [Trichuris trichiura]|uniref:Uncharacterized protein n=1 Tax=Trichuris trichiura TaxID=36087 RepID=A0A077ZJR6_TRITR|nr:hypothetical protein TTRE_0000900701 [Trichuris trichiura]